MSYTTEQSAFIHHQQGHARCIAVAGSGKTHTLVGLIEHAVGRGVDPQKIAVVMFNTAAADQFRQRLKQQSAALPIDVRTFNSMGEKLTRFFEARDLLPVRTLETRGYVIEGFARKALGHYLQDYADDTLESFLSFIDFVKSSLLPAREVFESTEFREKAFISAFEAYEKLLARHKLRTYADQVWLTTKTIMANPVARQLVENRLEMLLVDEFQDASLVQLELVRALAGNTAQVLVVGDADQAIYEFRGSDPAILNHLFGEYFPAAATYRLSHTFRYGHRLSLLANHVISRNSDRMNMLCVSDNANPDTQVSLHPSGSASTQVMQLIAQWQQRGSPGSLAVLFRLKAQSTAVMLELLINGVSFELRNIPFVLDDRYIRALHGLLHYAHGSLFAPAHESRFVELMALFPSGLKKDAMSAAVNRCIQRKSLLPLYDLASQIRHDYARKRYLERLGIIKTFNGSRLDAHSLLNRFVNESELYAAIDFSASTPTAAEERKLVVQGIIQYFSQHRLSIAEALRHLEQMLQQHQDGRSTGNIVLATVHAAKGLEWDEVILAGLEEGLFPYTKKDQANIEQERRLFYVAATRAVRHLYLVCPDDPQLSEAARAKSGFYPALEQITASRFLFEANLAVSNELGAAIVSRDSRKITAIASDRTDIGNQYLAAAGFNLNLTYRPPVGRKPPQPALAEENPPPLRIGSVIEHKRFGRGVVKATRDDNLVQIAFPGKLSWFNTEVMPYALVAY